MFAFEWDPAKAAANIRKHEVDFNLAATVFRDPLHISIPDTDRSVFEERWVTMGQAGDGRLLVVSHTDRGTDGDRAIMRIISARPATPRERRQFESGI